VLDWLEEIYCDLFALCLAGPSFSFAFIDLLSLTRFEPSRDFQNSHPANALRLREQAKLLQDPASGWWNTISVPGNHYVAVLEAALFRQDSDFKYGTGGLGSVDDFALKCFLSLVGRPKDAVLSLFAGIDSGVSEYTSKVGAIKAYLSYGIVPSRLVMNGGASVPSGMCLLNATYSFYLENLDELLHRLASVEAGCLECRAHWAQRVELWLGKALEDTNTNGYTVALSH
jgi:hypothetical protein